MIIVVVIAAYLLGSIPFSYLFSKLKGHDVREKGTKNVGATNALVVAGPIAGLLALIGDIFKGILAVLIARYFSLPDWGIALTALAAIVGHDFSIFLGFKGGKGVATTGGVLLALDPIMTVFILLLWILCMLIFQYFIPSTIIIMCFIPVMMWLASENWPFVVFALLNALLAVYAHRFDLQKFFDGNELPIRQSIAKHLGK